MIAKEKSDRKNFLPTCATRLGFTSALSRASPMIAPVAAFVLENGRGWHEINCAGSSIFFLGTAGSF